MLNKKKTIKQQQKNTKQFNGENMEKKQYE